MPQADLTTLAAEIISCREIHELPGDWPPAVLRSLLDGQEIDSAGTAEADLPDLALMALGDLEPNEAGARVLGLVFGEELAPGMRAQLAADLVNERPWEQLSDLSRQAGVFTATVLLQRAFPRHYGKPAAMRVEVALTAPADADAALLLQAPPAVVLRALAPGLGPASLVVRLYGDGLRGGDFPEAAQILWRHALRADPAAPRRVIADLCGAQAFLGTLGDAAAWSAEVALLPGD